MNVRALAKRRQAKRQRYESQRETEAEFFARVKRQIRRTERRAFHACVDARRREITWSVGAELARGATDLRYPPAPEPGDWEPPRLKLKLKPANLAD